jgi:hypothetical protein
VGQGAAIGVLARATRQQFDLLVNSLSSAARAASPCGSPSRGAITPARRTVRPSVSRTASAEIRRATLPDPVAAKRSSAAWSRSQPASSTRAANAAAIGACAQRC